MRIKSCIFFFVFTSVAMNLSAQAEKSFVMVFHPVFGNADLIPGETYYKLKNGDSLRFETLRFYISGIEFISKDKQSWRQNNNFHLLDASEPATLQGQFYLPASFEFNTVKFNLGIDSVTNVSGAIGGDLDPTIGMYWTWQSGYINLKLEGASNLCSTYKNEFLFHLGGYQSPFLSMQSISLPVSQNDRAEIVFDLGKFFDQIDLSKQNTIMSPGEEAVTLSEMIARCFAIWDK